MYAEKFDKDLLDPFKTEEPEKRKDYPDDMRGEDHPLLARLWCEDVRKLEGDIKALASKKQSGDGLTTEQTDELERLGVRLADCQESANLLREKFKKNFWDYVVELQKSPLLGMIRFKKRIVVSLAKYGFHEGPLCDCLCYLNEWMLKTNKKEKVDTSSKGKWWYCIDGKAPSGVGNPSNAGYTQQGVDDEGKELWYQKDKKVVLVVTEADAVCPKLKDPRDSKLVDAMSEELQTRILKSTCLKEVKKSQSDILNDAFFRVVDEDFSRVFLTDRQDGYRGLVDSEGDIPEDDEFAFFDDNIRNAMVKSTAQKFNSAKTKLKSSSILRKMSHASRNEDDEDDEDDEQNTRDPMNPDPKQATAKSHSHDVNTASDLSMTKLMRAIDEKNKDTFRDWKQKWLPELFMKNIQEFNWRSVKFAGRQFLRGLRRNPVYLESLPPEGSSSNFENNWDEKIIHLSISADTQFVLIASKEKVEMERIEDLQPVLKYRPKSEEDIQAVACLSKLGEDVQLLAIVLPESIQLVAFTVDSESPTVWETKRSELYVSSGGQGPGSAENPNITSASFSADGEYLALAGKQKDDGGTDYGRVDVFSTAWIYEHRIDNDLPKKTRKLSLANFSSKSIAPSEKDDHHELPLGSKDHIADFLQKARGGTDLWTSGSQLRESKRKQDSCSNGLFYIYRRAPVNSIGWSPRGDRIVLGADNKSSALYVLPKTDDPEDWRKKWTRLGGKSFFEIPSDGKVVDTAFSGDGCRLCVARSMSVDIYDAVHGSFIGNIALHRTVYSAVFTQDGTRIAITCRNEDEAVQIFDANAQTQLYKKPFKGGARKVSFSPCGTFLVASGGRDEGEVRIVRPETGGVSYQKERSDAVGAIASSSDGKYFAFGFGKGPGRVEVAITKSGHIIHSHLVDKTARVVSFACMEVDGEVREVLLSLSSDSKESKIHIRELDSWEHKLTLVFPGEITSMASTKHFLAIALNVNLKSPGGEKLASIQDDTFVYDAFTSSPGKASDDAEELPKHHKHSPWLIPWKSLSSEVAVELDATTLTLAAMRPFPSLGNNIMTVDVVVPSINDGELQPMIAYGGLDKKAHIYDIPMRRWYEDDLRRAGVLKRYPSILYEADDKGGNAKAMLRERSRHTFSFDDVVRACCFSPNGDKFAVGGSMEIVAVYHTVRMKQSTDSLPHSLTHSFTHSLTHSLTHPLRITASDYSRYCRRRMSTPWHFPSKAATWQLEQKRLLPSLKSRKRTRTP
jgi:WD40 repeat protein